MLGLGESYINRLFLSMNGEKYYMVREKISSCSDTK